MVLFVKKIRNILKKNTDNNIMKKKERKGEYYVKEVQCRKLQRVSG